MAHKYLNILVHLVFSTKERADLIPEDLLPRLAKYLAGIGRNHGIPVLAAGGMPNHVHLLIALPSDVSVAKAVQVLKANSSRWIREHGIAFAWQEGYGAFSVSNSNQSVVVNYIEHRRSIIARVRMRRNSRRWCESLACGSIRRRHSGERVPSLRDSRARSCLPGTSVPGFPIPCLRHWDSRF